MDGISRSRGWDKEIPYSVLPMEQLVLSDKWVRNRNVRRPCVRQFLRVSTQEDTIIFVQSS